MSTELHIPDAAWAKIGRQGVSIGEVVEHACRVAVAAELRKWARAFQASPQVAGPLTSRADELDPDGAS